MKCLVRRIPAAISRPPLRAEASRIRTATRYATSRPTAQAKHVPPTFDTAHSFDVPPAFETLHSFDEFQIPELPTALPPALQSMEAFKTVPSFLLGARGFDAGSVDQDTPRPPPASLDSAALQQRDSWHEDMLYV